MMKMSQNLKASLFATSLLFTVIPSGSAQANESDEPLALQKAKVLRVYEAPEADQGVAVDGNYFYAADNYIVAKYDKETGQKIDRWDGGKGGPIAHINSCKIYMGSKLDELICANSNYPEIPHSSSIEIFDTEDLRHKNSHSLGILDEGSLTWLDKVEGGWIAGFAHYEKRGGVSFKGAEFASVVSFNEDWTRRGGWEFPKDITDRMAPYAASGGAIGPDGFLYVMGHDLPEMYVFAKPKMGPTLIHLETLYIEAHGQAFSWDYSANARNGARIVYTVDRQAGRVKEHEIPFIKNSSKYAQTFR